jgi:hypothetical protein
MQGPSRDVYILPESAPHTEYRVEGQVSTFRTPARLVNAKCPIRANRRGILGRIRWRGTCLLGATVELFCPSLYSDLEVFLLKGGGVRR